MVHNAEAEPAVMGHAMDRLMKRLETMAALDRVSGPLTAFVQRVLPQGRVRDLLHGLPLGHPAHPLLVQVPLGAWLSATALDAVPGTERAALVLTGVGTAAAAPAALTGITDWSSIHQPEQRVGLVHWISNTIAVGCYAASFVQRLRGRTGSGRMLGLAGLAVASVGGYLGGHLAYRQAIGANHTERVPYVVSEGWHYAGELIDLPDRTMTMRIVETVPVLLYRVGERVWALADECSHLAGPLHEGELVEAEGAAPCVVCPWHESTFALDDGSVVHGPATSPQPHFATRVQGGAVEVQLTSS